MRYSAAAGRLLRPDTKNDVTPYTGPCWPQQDPRRWGRDLLLLLVWYPFPSARQAAAGRGLRGGLCTAIEFDSVMGAGSRATTTTGAGEWRRFNPT